MKKFLDPRVAVTAIILIYFGYSIFMHWSSDIEMTVINLVIAVAGYWLGSSRGSAEKNAMLQKGDGE